MFMPEWDSISDNALRDKIRRGTHPVILKGLAKSWPLVDAGYRGMDAVFEYLMRFDQEKKFEAMIAPTSANKRLFYNADLSGFNFDKMTGSLKEALDIIKVLSAHTPSPSFYIGSTFIPEYLPGMENETPLSCLDAGIIPKIWISNSATVATHNDNSENIACVAVGRRRFTLFPPEQEGNLYIGPAEITPAGRPISLVDLNNPDFERFPLFRRAFETIQIADLGPGDAIYIPTGWWHHVESLDSFNILINFWWQGDPPKFPTI